MTAEDQTPAEVEAAALALSEFEADAEPELAAEAAAEIESFD